MRVDVPENPSTETDYDLVRRMRASISVLGPLVARCGSARVALPGGDAIGSRGLDMHIAGLERLGATIVQRARLPRGHRTPAHRHVDLAGLPLRGATENLVMAAVLADGTTVIDNAAREPEIVDICAMLGGWAPALTGPAPRRSSSRASTRSRPVTYTTVPDRIVAGTWAIGAVMTRGTSSSSGPSPRTSPSRWTS